MSIALFLCMVGIKSLLSMSMYRFELTATVRPSSSSENRYEDTIFFYCTPQGWKIQLCDVQQEEMAFWYLFSEDDDGRTVAVNSKRYIDMLRKLFIPAIQRKRAVDMTTFSSNKMGRLLIVPTAHPRIYETVFSWGQTNFE